MIANPAIEQMSREDMAQLQLKKLKKQLRWAMEKSAFYYRKFTDAGIRPGDIQSLADIEKLPFTTTDELQSASAYNMLALPMSGVLRVSRLGCPKAFIKMHTNGDLAYQIEMMTRVLVAQGINGAVVIGLMGEASDSLLMDIQYALENMGATVILLGNNPENIKELLSICHMDVLLGNHCQLMELWHMLQDSGQFVDEVHLPRVICMEDLESLNNIDTQQRLGTEIVSVYSSAALGCGGIMFPCQENSDSFHIQEDYFYPEVVERDTDKLIMASHKPGELVLTSLSAEAMPVFRYRTGQIVMRLDGSCPCGRTLLQLAFSTQEQITSHYAYILKSG